MNLHGMQAVGCTYKVSPILTSTSPSQGTSHFHAKDNGDKKTRCTRSGRNAQVVSHIAKLTLITLTQGWPQRGSRTSLVQLA